MATKTGTIWARFFSAGAVLGLSVFGLLAGGCDSGSVHAQLVGDMSVDPDHIPTSGEAEAEVAVWVYLEGAARTPIEGAQVELLSSRNQGGNLVDMIEQPGVPTDTDGRGVAFIGSTTVGEAGLVVEVNGAPLCDHFEAGKCVRLQKMVTFFLVCSGGLTNCSGDCVDTGADPENCGECGIICTFDNATPLCDAGNCAMGDCDLGWGDCNLDPADGCETNVMGDRENCGSCGNACPQDLGCLNGNCSITCHDDDLDGFDDDSCGGADCDDSDPDSYPGATETCDGADNDCDGVVDQLPDASISCDDGNECTADVCQRGRGCVNIDLQEGSCDDGDDCTMNDTCRAGACFGTPFDGDGDGHQSLACGGDDCDDGNAAVYPGAFEGAGLPQSCTDGLDNDCDGLTDMEDGLCNPCTSDAYCDDNDLCNGTETCIAGACRVGTPVDCDDTNECTNDSCDPATGVCGHVDNTASCEDGDLCTVGDACSGGACQPGGSSLDCNDANDCTDDTCQPASGCVHTNNTIACDDLNQCTVGDACAGGFCQPGSQTLACDDSNGCTDDSCDPAQGGCVFTPNAAPCNDGDPCTQGDSCGSGTCQPGGPKFCGDANVCTDDSCDGATGNCLHSDNTAACDDGSDCTQGDVCANGFCSGVPRDQDGDGFGDDSCGGSDCDDNDENVRPDMFEGPAGSPLCSDGIDNNCNLLTDAADPTCSPCTVDDDCNDNIVCNGIEQCIGGNCQAGTLLDCDDNNPCTDDSCDAVTGCVNWPNINSCSDGDMCTQDDVCQGGVCVGTNPVVCTALDQCHTIGVCNPATGACSNPNSPDGVPCNDNSLCTASDTCQAGVCTGQNPVVCTPLDSCHNAGVCNPSSGTCSNPVKPDGSGCNDGNLCTQVDTCSSGNCNGASPVQCVALDSCHNAGICNPATGSCTDPTKPDGTPCDDGDACTLTDGCLAGACTGSNPVVCTASDQCHAAGVCNPASGVCSDPPVSDGSPCDDANMCTQTDTCQTGICAGSNPVVCMPQDSCHDAGNCNPATGNCSNPAKPDGSTCDDGNPCTQTDTCLAGACGGANPIVCTPLDQCHVAGICNPATGNCSNPNSPDGSGCDDSDLCTQTDTCQAGVCAGADPVACSPLDQCHDAGICNPATGSCTDPASPNGKPCNDADLCTQTDTCQSGVCTGSNPVSCVPLDQCHDAGACQPATGSCTNPNKPDGSGCDDGNLCTQTDACQSGSCAGSNPVVCTPLDQCHSAGTCQPATGSCTNPNRPDGTSCDDGDLCTQTDTCQAGACSGASPVVCTALDQCHVAGVCNPGTGSCSNPPSPDGTSCNDSNLCTQTDTCQSGSCAGSNPVVCLPLDQCHLSGTCQPATGSCTNPNQPDGSVCDDLNDCSSTDTCQGGGCIAGATDKDTDGDTYLDWSCPGGTDCYDDDPLINPGASEGPNGDPTCSDGWDNDCDTLADMLDSGCMQCIVNIDCEDFNACTTDTCVGGICHNDAVANGTGCDDGDLCTQSDTCQAGSCTGSNPVACTALDQCHNAGICNPATGSCSNPAKPNGSSCDDGDLCTQTDSCQAGSCTGSNPVACSPLDQCHNAGICNPGTGSCSNPQKPDGTSCDDGNLCTQSDSCQAGSCTGSNPVTCTALDQCHNVGSCNPATGSCSNPQKPDGSGCDDGDLCTQSDTCQAGSCTGSNPVVCTATDQCHNAGTCNPATGSCSNPNKPNGSACDDGDLCTQTDTCQVGSCQGSDPLACTPLDQCHNAGVCNPATGSCSNPQKPDGSGCDDGDLCTQTDTCQAGNCTGSNPVSCTALDQCHDVGSCNPSTGSCSNPQKPDGSGCDDGDLCTQTDTCQAGSCTGSNPVNCTALDQCHNAGTCNPATGSCGNPQKPNGTSCDDGDLCTQTDTCQSGSCIGADPVTCTPLDQCHNAGTCNPGTGSCSNPQKPDGSGCNDGNLCTQADTCQSGSCTGSNPVICTPLDQCHDAGVCNPATGGCSNPAKPDGQACDDGDLCSQTDTCQSGSCSGANPTICTPLDQCHVAGICNPATGSCSNPNKSDGSACDDGDFCSQADTCQGGSCVTGATDKDTDGDTYLDGSCPGGNDCDDNRGFINPGETEGPYLDPTCGDSWDNDCDTFVDMNDSGCMQCIAHSECEDGNPCTTDLCISGECQNNPVIDGTACDDSNLCTQTDTCQAGSCMGSDPVVCTALDQCHNTGTCNPGTGSCSNPQKPNGTSCDDGDLCTQTDTCQSGSCTGTDPVVCSAQDQCHTAGTCNPATGNCSNPQKPNGTSCDDGDLCTQTDTCQSGTCSGSNPVSCTPLDQCHNTGTCNPATGSCSNPQKPDGTSCDDGDLCTQTDTCQSGTCSGSNPVSCTPLDQCHNAGTCNPATGSCSNPNKPNGTACDDGDLCTQTDTCQSGTCTGANPIICSAQDQCHDSGTCNPATGSCSNPSKPDGSACDDGNLCTQTDTCQSGSCTGSNPVSCTALDQCHNAGTCQPATGNCTNPNKPDGTGCDDADFCTQTDTCQSGTCTGSNPVICTALDQCHNAGTCNPASGDCSNPNKPNGTACDDGDLCTQTDTCQSGSCTGANPIVCTALDQCHDVGTCQPATGNCTNPNKPNGTACDDSNFCTQTDTCQSGSCSGSNPVVCTPLDQCHNAGTCQPATGNCTNPQKPNGTGCDDGDLCTQTDTCQSGSCTGSNPVICTPLDQCHIAGTCNPGSGSCSNPNRPNGTACDDLNLCTQTDTCQSGTCSGSNPVVCTPLDQCHIAGVCNPGTGNCSNPNSPNGTACNDGNICSTLDTCQDGSCTAGATTKDTDGDTYLDGSCPGGDDCDDNQISVNPGASEGPFGDSTCADGWDNDCDTFFDINDTDCMQCIVNIDCEDFNACTTDTCVGGVCNNTPVANGTGCNDSDLCTQTDTCQGGVCTGSNPVVCTASDQCHAAGTCNPVTGACSNPPKPNGTPCDDSDLCTQTDTCQAGTCTGADPVVCTALDQCHNVGVCQPATGSCTNPNKPNGTGCNDGDLCTQTDTCQSGTCTGSNPVVCTALDQCHNVGVCQPATGSCTNPNKPNGTGCNDGDLCTQTDTCQSGTCTGSNPVVCTPLDQCHNVGICQPATGNCTNPNKPDGTGCDDSDLCTQTDTCQTGTCTGSNPVVCTPLDQCHDAGICQPATGNCTNPNKPNGTNCNDSDLCTQTDTCQSGTCTGSNPVVCTPLDQCHNAGICQPATGNCTNPNKPNGTNCDDGDLCTQIDTCQTGTCTGSNPVICNPLDQCHNAGICQPASGNCTNPNKPDGTNCDDGDLCTQTDTCQTGICTGSNPVVCTPLDQCHNAGICNSGTGNCSNPNKPDGTNCDDSNMCTQTDTCQTGICTGSSPVVCTPLDQCHNAGTCQQATGNCTNPNKPDGTNCDDADLCTQTDTCQSGTCTGSNPIVCTPLDQCHNAGTCQQATGNCTDPNKPDGTNCDDSNLCTQTDTCQTGICTGSNPVVCTPLDQCHNAGTCQQATGNCTNPQKPEGSACSDGEPCSFPDSCQSGTCTGTPYSCDDNSPCTSDSCNGDGTCTFTDLADPSVDPDYEWYETRCGDGIDNDCDGCIDENCPGYPNPIIAVEVIPYSTLPGLVRLSGNAQFGPVGVELPEPLLVQVNDGTGAPLTNEMVTFKVEPLTDGIDPEDPANEGVCYGSGQTQYNCSGPNLDRICPIQVMKVCNNALGTLLDQGGSPFAQLQVPTDENGQARVRIMMPAAETGFMVVSAAHGGDLVYFFAASTQELSSTITLPTLGDSYPAANPAFGPLIQTRWDDDSQSSTYMADFASYTLAITGLSIDDGTCSPGELPQTGIAAGGSLTICGRGFASSGNTVWVGGIQANITAESTTAITVDVPEGLPGASTVKIADGTTTICKDDLGHADSGASNFGQLASSASAAANFWRLGSKPIFIFAKTGSQAGSSATVKLLGLDTCGNPLGVLGHSLSLDAYNPVTPYTNSNAVTAGSPNATTGVATVVDNGSGTVRSAVLVGTLDGMSSNDYYVLGKNAGNMVVSAVPRLATDTFEEYSALGNNNGVNSLIIRGADESSSSEAQHQNPGIRLSDGTESVDLDVTTSPTGMVPFFETESNISLGTMTGEGWAANMETSFDFYDAAAGTSLGVITGGVQGLIAVLAANVGIDPSTDLQGTTEIFMSVPPVVMSGQTLTPNGSGDQEINLNYDAMLFMEDSDVPAGGYPRGLDVRILVKRAMP